MWSGDHHPTSEKCKIKHFMSVVSCLWLDDVYLLMDELFYSDSFWNMIYDVDNKRVYSPVSYSSFTYNIRFTYQLLIHSWAFHKVRYFQTDRQPAYVELLPGCWTRTKLMLVNGDAKADFNYAKRWKAIIFCVLCRFMFASFIITLCVEFSLWFIFNVPGSLQLKDAKWLML